MAYRLLNFAYLPAEIKQRQVYSFAIWRHFGLNQAVSILR